MPTRPAPFDPDPTMNPNSIPMLRRVCVVPTLAAMMACLALAACSKNDTPPLAEQSSALEAPSTASAPAPSSAIAAVEPTAPRLASGERIDRTSEHYPVPSEPFLSESRKEKLTPYPDLGRREAGYFDGKFLAENARKALLKKDFEGEAAALGNEARADGMARQKAYTAVFQAALARYSESVRLQGLNCGRIACMGSIRASNLDFLQTIGEDLRAGGLPLPSLAWQPVQMGSQYDVRFVFTTKGPGGFQIPN